VWGPAVPCDLPAEPQEPGLDWDRWLGPAPVRPYNSILSPRGVHDHFPRWRKYREYGGGGVTDWGAHHFDIVQWALDMDESGPVEFFPPEDPGKDSGVRFVYANGTEVLHTGAESGKQNGIWFYGSEGKMYVNRKEFQLWIGKEQKAESMADLDAVDAHYLGEKAKRVYNSHDHHGDWMQCIETRKRPIADVEIGARTVTVCDLVDQAYYHGKPFKWDPKKNNFADGTGNPKWLDVEYRDPWKLS
jgi:predicted dehydrogenase